MPFQNGNLPSIKDIIKQIVDDLNRFLIMILLILIILTIFVRTFVLDVIKFLILGIIIFRISSKNKFQRTKENNTFIKIKNRIFHPLKNDKKEKDKVFKKCKKCKTILKLPLPKKRGINYAKCPNCGNRVKIISLRKAKTEKIKVEVIKKNKSR